MIAGLGPVLQALLGTALTWALTAAGSALVFVFSSGQVSAATTPCIPPASRSQRRDGSSSFPNTPEGREFHLQSLGCGMRSRGSVLGTAAPLPLTCFSRAGFGSVCAQS